MRHRQDQFAGTVYRIALQDRWRRKICGISFAGSLKQGQFTGSLKKEQFTGSVYRIGLQTACITDTDADTDTTRYYPRERCKPPYSDSGRDETMGGIDYLGRDRRKKRVMLQFLQLPLSPVNRET